MPVPAVKLNRARSHARTPLCIRPRGNLSAANIFAGLECCAEASESPEDFSPLWKFADVRARARAPKFTIVGICAENHPATPSER